MIMKHLLLLFICYCIIINAYNQNISDTKIDPNKLSPFVSFVVSPNDDKILFSKFNIETRGTYLFIYDINKNLSESITNSKGKEILLTGRELFWPEENKIMYLSRYNGGCAFFHLNTKEIETIFRFWDHYFDYNTKSNGMYVTINRLDNVTGWRDFTGIGFINDDKSKKKWAFDEDKIGILKDIKVSPDGQYIVYGENKNGTNLIKLSAPIFCCY